MAETTASNNAPLSLPKGGGAIKGIGETFQPNLFTGTGNISVPIYTSPGRNDFGPKLSLQYSSGNGNSAFGVGWSLSIPRITRKTEKGLPQYRDTDVFVMSGAEDLVPVLDNDNKPVVIKKYGYLVNRYRPRTEGLFARLEKWEHETDITNIHWRVTTKENVTSIYGKQTSARISDPGDPSKIYEWLLEETFDVKGNHILYEYVNESSLQGRLTTQTYIRRILYGNTPDILQSSQRAGPVKQATHHLYPEKDKYRHYCFEVLFDYFDLPDIALTPGFDWRQLDSNSFTSDIDPANHDFLRQDPFSSFRASFEIRTLRRCNGVLMLHHFNEDELLNSPLVKSTDFNYDINADTLLSFLVDAKVTGYRVNSVDTARYLSRDMPPVSFKYSAFKPQKQRYKNIVAEGGDLPPVSLNNPSTRIMDFFGNGMPDIVQSTPAGLHYWENKGDAAIGRRHPQHGDQPSVTLDQANVSLGDMGGDGLLDLVVDAPLMSGFFEATPDGQWKPFKKFKDMPTFNLSDPNTRLVDLTGDGLSDILVTDDHSFIWYQSKGEEGFTDQKRISRQHKLEDFPDVYFDDPAGRVRLADMTGDGLADIVLLHDGRVDYWPNLGYGRFGKRITMFNTPHIGYSYDPRRLFLADLDGSGTADLVYIEFNSVKFWFNQSGNAWSDTQVINGTPYTVDTTSIQFSDFYGTGTSCLIWSYDYNRQPGGNYKLLDFCGGKKPNLLNEMDNNMGATTRSHYASSSKFYLEDKKNGKPWITALPFPVQVLEKTEVIDHISNTKLVSTYKYHHGYYDGKEREFRGFGRVDQYDTETFNIFDKKDLHGSEGEFTNSNKAYHVPPVLTKNWYHTGIYFDTNLSSTDGKLYNNQDMLEAYRDEYYQDDHLAFVLKPNEVEATDALHEAYRVLRGSVLRTEVYTTEDSVKSKHPYTVTENRYQVKQLQTRHQNYHGVFLSISKESLSYHYERNPDDPRISQNLTLACDNYGNVTQALSVAYPRRRPLTAFKNEASADITDSAGKAIAPYEEQRKLKAIYTFSDFINKNVEAQYYYIGVPYQSRVFEVHGLSWQWKPADELYDLPPEQLSESSFTGLENPDEYIEYENIPAEGSTALKKRLIDWNRQYFRKDSAAGLTTAVDFTLSETRTLETGNSSTDPATKRAVEPFAVIMPENKTWLFYYDRRHGRFEVRYQIHDDATGVWSESIDLIDEANALEWMFRPFSDTNNNIWVFNSYTENGKYFLWYKKYNWANKIWDENQLLLNDIEFMPTVKAVEGVNGEVWVFISVIQELSDYNISYFHYSPDTGWSDQQFIENQPGTVDKWAKVVKDNKGDIWLFWSSNRTLDGTPATENYKIWYKHFPVGSITGNAEQIIDQQEFTTLYPDPKVDKDNNIWLFGIDYFSQDKFEYGYSMLDRQNNSWSAFKTIMSKPAIHGNFPQALFEEDGMLSLYWGDNRENTDFQYPVNSFRTKYRLYYNRYNPVTDQLHYKNDIKLSRDQVGNESHRIYPVLRRDDGSTWVLFYNWYDDISSEIQYIEQVPGVDNDKLALGEIDQLGLPYETYQAAFTQSQLALIYDTKLNIKQVEQEGAYVKLDDISDAHQPYYWIPSGRQAFNRETFFQVNQTRDIFGNISSVDLDDYALLPVTASDALPSPQTNRITSKNNYRVLQPYEVTDPNGNKSQVAFDALGLVVGTAISGDDENGNRLGDTLDEFIADIDDELRNQHITDPLNINPLDNTDPHNILKGATTRLMYDLKRYMNSGEPNVVYSLARETHVSDEKGLASKVQHSFVYSDGFGREYQSKIQAEPSQDKPDIPRWVGTGTKIYNNKGKPVQEFEPFFSDTHLPGIEQHGVSPTLFYDPLERVVCTLHPNHSWEKVAFDPWHKKTWDVNDTIHPSFRYHTQDILSFTPVEMPDSIRTYVGGIDDSGNIVGTYDVNYDIRYGYKRDVNSVIQTIEFPDSNTTVCTDINEQGMILGSCYLNETKLWHGYTFSHDVYTSVDYPDGAHTFPNGINDQGNIVGQFDPTPLLAESRNGFQVTEGNYSALNYPGAESTHPFDINNSGHIVGGYYGTDKTFKSFGKVDDTYYQITYPVTDPGSDISVATGINDIGQITGVYTDEDGFVNGYLEDNGSFSRFYYPAAVHTRPTGINNHGIIVGNYTSEDEKDYGFIASPLDTQYKNYSPIDDEDTGYFFSRLPTEQYLPTWYNMRSSEEQLVKLWPDVNDNGEPLPAKLLKRNELRRASEKNAALQAIKHSATPSVEYLDVLGRPFLSVADNGKKFNEENHLIKTHITLDIEGNDLKITDPRGVDVFEHRFDLAGRKLFIKSIDAGDKWLFLSADNQPIKTWDANDNITSITYDVLRRPVETRVKRPAPYNDSIRSQCIVYGEQLTTDNGNEIAAKNNHRGQAYLSLDSAGVVVGESFDFKGNPLTSKQVLISDRKAQSIDWSELNLSASTTDIWNSMIPVLDDEVFHTSVQYDALNRITQQAAPDHTSAKLNEAKPTDGSIYRNIYNVANLIEKVEIKVKSETSGDFTTYVKNINYDAKGQRQSITYGNGVTTEYTYDDYTYRLTNIKTTRTAGGLLQDLDYTYDPVGNITEINDHAIKTVYYNQQAIKPTTKYTYDAIYRLKTATGREHIAMGSKAIRDASNGSKKYFRQLPDVDDTQALQMYTEYYEYDDSGNFSELKHHRGENLNGQMLWHRKQDYDEDDQNRPVSNRITRSGADAEDSTKRDRYYQIMHDPNGNMLNLSSQKNIIWDHNNRLSRLTLDKDGKKNAYYQYDLTGQRIRKYVDKGGTTEERLYIGGFEIYRKHKGDKLQVERQTLHVMDDKDRIAMLEIEGKVKKGKVTFTEPKTRYQLNNHLGSSVLEVGDADTAAILSVEEYYPYGGTSFTGGQSHKEASSKRYKYSGKERDNESGLYYYGARYYAPWLGRWCSVDPAGTVDGVNIYLYSLNNPIKYIDIYGTNSIETNSVESGAVNPQDGRLVNSGNPQDPSNYPDLKSYLEGSKNDPNRFSNLSELLYKMSPDNIPKNEDQNSELYLTRGNTYEELERELGYGVLVGGETMNTGWFGHASAVKRKEDVIIYHKLSGYGGIPVDGPPMELRTGAESDVVRGGFTLPTGNLFELESKEQNGKKTSEFKTCFTALCFKREFTEEGINWWSISVAPTFASGNYLVGIGGEAEFALRVYSSQKFEIRRALEIKAETTILLLSIFSGKNVSDPIPNYAQLRIEKATPYQSNIIEVIKRWYDTRQSVLYRD